MNVDTIYAILGASVNAFTRPCAIEAIASSLKQSIE
jgi:hypothetical protein